MRVVLDVNVLISALLSRRGSPAQLLIAWQEGEFDLIVSPNLLAELRQALAYPKLARLVPSADADRFVAWISGSAVLAADSAAELPVRPADPGDDYLIALAAAERAILVSGDSHITALASDFPIHTPAAFVAILRELRR